MALRTVYLQRMPSINGRNALSGRVLYDQFQHLSEEVILGHMIMPDEEAEDIKNPDFKADVISYKLLREFQPNIIFMEGGLFAGGSTWKFPENAAKDYRQSGGVLIVADADVNELRQRKKAI